MFCMSVLLLHLSICEAHSALNPETLPAASMMPAMILPRECSIFTEPALPWYCALAAPAPPSHAPASSGTASQCCCSLLAHQPVHWPGFPQAHSRAEAPVAAASPAAQRAHTPLVPASHLSAPEQVRAHKTRLAITAGTCLC